MSSTPTLANRLRRVTTDLEETETMEQVLLMSYAELGKAPIKFGTAKKGMPFREVVKDVRYTTWFSETYPNSQKLEHRKFLHYVKLHVEELEKAPHTRPKSAAKSTAKPKAQPTETPPLSESSEDEELWDKLSVPNPEVGELQQRMSRMENVMEQILAHLNGAKPSQT